MRHYGDYAAGTVLYFQFTTYRPSSGASYTLAGTPVVRVYKNGSTTQHTTTYSVTADFDSITGLNYFTIDTSADGTFYAAGNTFHCVLEAGTVDSVSVVGTVVASFTLDKEVAASRLPTATPGASNGLVIVGTNSAAISFTAGMTISNAAGSALTCSSSGGNGRGIYAAGNGSGSGIRADGGATGHGIYGVGGATSGSGVRAEAIGGNVNGFYAIGFGTGHGAYFQGGSTSTGSGLYAIGGPTGHGMRLVGGATSGRGLYASAAGAGAGAYLEGVGTGAGLSVQGGDTDAAGMVATGGGNGHGMTLTRGVTGGGDDLSFANADATVPIVTTVNGLAAGAVTATAVATGAIDADALASDAVAEIADQVWDELLAGHAGVGSTGAALSAAGGSGDPWATALPGAYGAGTAGKIIGDRIDAAISSRAVAGDAMTLAAGAVTATAVATGAIDADALAADAVTEIADAILARDLGSGTGEGVAEERTVRAALRFLRNKWTAAGGTLTVYKEDDATSAWTSALTGTAGADPITASDPT